MGGDTVERLIAKQAITEVLMRYSRGLDRGDEELLQSVYWPDAIDDHGTFTGPASEYVKHVMRAIPAARITHHVITNVHIELDGDKARTECYVTAHHESASSDSLWGAKVGGRYIDRFERRDGEWRILHRLMVMDWYDGINREDAEKMPIAWSKRTQGGRRPNDPWYAAYP